MTPSMRRLLLASLLTAPACFEDAPALDAAESSSSESGDSGGLEESEGGSSSSDGESSSEESSSTSDGSEFGACPGSIGCPCTEPSEAPYLAVEECGEWPSAGHTGHPLSCMGDPWVEQDVDWPPYMVCTHSCESDEQCVDAAPWGPLPVAGVAGAICDVAIAACVVPCADASECADGMTCQRRGDRDGEPLHVCVRGS
jgi:hypothetical protein